MVAPGQTTRREAPSWASDNGNGTYSNPLFYDEFSDPDMIRVGSDFYLTGTTMHTGSSTDRAHARRSPGSSRSGPVLLRVIDCIARHLPNSRIPPKRLRMERPFRKPRKRLQWLLNRPHATVLQWWTTPVRGDRPGGKQYPICTVK
jgi:hypothetical protein